jgi:hypothetical protein
VHTSTKSQDLRDLKDMLKADDVSPEEARSIKAAIQAVQKDSNKERLVKVRLPRAHDPIRWPCAHVHQSRAGARGGRDLRGKHL